MDIGPSNKASSRTKNRVNEHSLIAARTNTRTPIRSSMVAGFKQHEGPFMLFFCGDNDCAWRGWIPTRELNNVPD